MPRLPKGPSRFIPTLTDVVVEACGPNTSDLPAGDMPEARERIEVSAGQVPLTLSTHAAPALSAEGFTAASTQAQSPLVPGFEEYVVHRVMQRLDVALDQRLRDAIATVVNEQTRSLLPRLREEVESVLRQVVYEAVADELATGEKTGYGKK